MSRRRRLHSWESDDDGNARRSRSRSHSWDNSDDGDGEGCVPSLCDSGDEGQPPQQSDSDSECEVAEETPGEKLLGYFIDMYLQKDMVAKQICTAAYHAFNAGVKECALIKVNPNAPSGHFQRKLDKKLPFLKGQTETMYTFGIPSWDKRALARSTHNFRMIPHHELLEEEYRSDPLMRMRLDEAIEGGDLPPAYHQHKAVLDFPMEPIIPLSLYLDGVPYASNDSVIGFWITNEVTRSRHCIGVLRKALVCRCGCRGWCTYYPIFAFIEWSMVACYHGRYPEGRHDLQPWAAADSVRQQEAGGELSYKACLIWLKADWSELQSTVGFPSWRDGFRPCFDCNATTEELYDEEELNVLEMPWRPNTDDDYYESCERCELVVSMDQAVHARIVREHSLEYDRRDHGNRGLCVLAPIQVGPIALQVGDRLEPSRNLMDVGKFFELVLFPIILTFWRPSRETVTRHRNPLFNRVIGITPHRCLTIDALHCLFLGVLLVWCREAVWSMFLAHIYGRFSTIGETIETAVLALSAELDRWYKMRHGENPNGNITRISRVTPKMVGDQTDKKCKTKGAETWGFLRFLVWKMRRCEARLDARGKSLLRAGEALEQMIEVFNHGGTNLGFDQTQRAWDMWKRHCSNTEDIDELHIPKRHLVAHLLAKMHWMGNPTKYACWMDESDNKILKKSCRLCSQVSFESSVLLRMRERARRVRARVGVHAQDRT